MNPFGYFKPSEEMLPVIQEVRDAYTTLHQKLVSLPASRERSVAIDQESTQPEEKA